MTKLIILDRDGVINYENDNYIRTLDEWIPIPGSLKAIAALNQQGFKIAVATNQAGIGHGYYDEEVLSKIHQKMRRALEEVGGRIDVILHCPHKDADQCDCRKPKPGLLHTIADHFDMTLNGVMFIGDSYTDLLAARTANCKPVLVKTGYGQETLSDYELNDVPVFDNLSDAVERLFLGIKA